MSGFMRARGVRLSVGVLMTCTTGACSTGVHSGWYGGGGASLPRSLQLKTEAMNGLDRVVVCLIQWGCGPRRRKDQLVTYVVSRISMEMYIMN